MEILNYSLIALITAVGLACGAVIGYFAKEELKPGKKYFILLQKILFTLAIAFLMYANRANVHYLWAGGLIIFIYLYFYERINQAFAYAFLALVFSLASETGMFLPISASIFLYGFPAGSLNYKNKKMILICNILFIILAVILFFLIKSFKYE